MWQSAQLSHHPLHNVLLLLLNMCDSSRVNPPMHNADTGSNNLAHADSWLVSLQASIQSTAIAINAGVSIAEMLHIQ